MRPSVGNAGTLCQLFKTSLYSSPFISLFVEDLDDRTSFFSRKVSFSNNYWIMVLNCWTVDLDGSSDWSEDDSSRNHREHAETALIGKYFFPPLPRYPMLVLIGDFEDCYLLPATDTNIFHSDVFNQRGFPLGRRKQTTHKKKFSAAIIISNAVLKLGITYLWRHHLFDYFQCLLTEFDIAREHIIKSIFFVHSWRPLTTKADKQDVTG